MASAGKLGRGVNKLFVGNLPWTICHQELRKYFENFGKVVNARVIFDRKTGCSKGYGFVTIANLSTLEKIENEQKHVLEWGNLNIQKQIN